MSNIDFQNGFICGMATRGLTKSIIVDPSIAYMINRTARDSLNAQNALKTIGDSVAVENDIVYPPPFDPLPEPDAVESFNANTASLSDDATVVLF